MCDSGLAYGMSYARSKFSNFLQRFGVTKCTEAQPPSQITSGDTLYLARGALLLKLRLSGMPHWFVGS